MSSVSESLSAFENSQTSLNGAIKVIVDVTSDNTDQIVDLKKSFLENSTQNTEGLTLLKKRINRLALLGV